MLEEEEYVGSSISQSYTQPMDFFIEPLEEDMKCIKVTNKGQETVNLGGHKLSCTSEGELFLLLLSTLINLHPLRLGDDLPIPKNCQA